MSSIPASAWRLIILEFWERFSYYGILAILVLFLTHPNATGGLGWTDSRALDLLSKFAAIAFMLPMLGGYVADRWMGTRRAVLVGACLLVAGNAGIAASAILREEWMLYAGLAGVALGNGFFKSSLVTLLGSLIIGDDAARDRAFRYYYQAIMLGALAASLCVGGLAENVGWWSGFALAAIGMTISFAIYVIWPPPAPVAATVATSDLVADDVPASRVALDVAVLCLFLLVITVAWVQFQGVWLLEMDRSVDRSVGTFTVPASWLLSVNAIGVVFFTGISGRLWRRYVRPGFALQFATAFAIMGLAHLLMAYGFSSSVAGGVPLLWPVVGMLIITAAELIFWPSGYNAMHRIAPARSKSLVMGVWLATLGVGQYVAHQIGRSADVIGFSAMSTYIGVAMLIACVAVLIISRMRPTLRAV